MREYSYPQACPREFEEELVDVRADGGKQVPFRVVDTPLKVPSRPGLVHDFSFCRSGTLPSPVLMPSSRLSLRQQWFTHVRLLAAHLTADSGPFPTLTTHALNRAQLAVVWAPHLPANPRADSSGLTHADIGI